MEGGAHRPGLPAQRRALRRRPSPVSDHLFSDNQAQEYFDFGEALERLGKIVLPLALKLKEEA